ncbi:hypothetical protein LTR37_009087 [Vermiconidia calcicola]|uniref:Uncharacterized protein n=1 Tax=Vermiconidia calcicola TaxID=1690605 RepID=A0ACC3N8K3_9PEZI|nr:hypothetical protein LTR37_009087 [Vermiconidia calcicola]
MTERTLNSEPISPQNGWQMLAEPPQYGMPSTTEDRDSIQKRPPEPPAAGHPSLSSTAEDRNIANQRPLEPTVVGHASVPPTGDERVSSPGRHRMLEHGQNQPQQSPQFDDVNRFARLLRQIRKLTDSVLLKRTEWRHAHQNLELRRLDFQNSSEAYMEAMKLQYSSVERRNKAYVQAIDTRPSEWYYPKTPGAQLDDQAYSASQKNESGVLSAEDTPSGYRRRSYVHGRQELSPYQTLENAFEQNCEDYKALVAQEAELKDMFEALSTLEYKVEAKEAIVSKLMHSGGFTKDLRTEMLDTKLAEEESESEPPTVDTTPPILAEYYDRKGDIGVFHERLQDLDFYHEEGRLERDFIRDRGDDVEVTDTEFESNYQARRAQILKDLAWAQAEAGRLEGECQRGGLDTNAHRASAPSMYADSSGAQPVPDNLLLMIRPVEPSLSPRPDGGEITSQRRIDTWLHNMSDLSEQDPGRPPSIGPIATPVSEKSSPLAFSKPEA